MGNIITNSNSNNKIIQMSNGLTSVFIETICLAGSDIAIENYQKDLMIWFAQRDWILLGMGLEGFDISCFFSVCYLKKICFYGITYN